MRAMVCARWAWTCFAVWACAAPALAQGTPSERAAAAAAEVEDDDFVSVADSSVGYIDSALPATQIRFRYDAGFNNQRPTRAEFFWPAGAGIGAPPGAIETSVDFQDLAATLEYAPTPVFSAFVDVPMRMINPDLNDNTAGFGDLSLGFKRSLYYDWNTVATFQFRVYTPTGNGEAGLGTDNTRLEPSFLLFRRVSENVRMESEARYWTALGGRPFSGDVIRYGMGFARVPRLDTPGYFNISPVVEFVGWTVLDGKVAVPGEGVENAAGDTIVNVKAGARWRFMDQYQIYAGYGRAITGDQWYEHIFRFELRKLF